MAVQIDLLDEDKDVDDVINLTGEERYCPVALEKMIALVTLLVEKSRGQDKQLHLSERDKAALIGGKVPLLFFFFFVSKRNIWLKYSY